MRRNLILLAIIFILAGAILYLALPSSKKNAEGGNKGEGISIQVTPEKPELLVSGFIMNAGERVEIEVAVNEGFLVDGEYEIRAVHPYDPDIFIQFQDPNGEFHRLAGQITGYQAEHSGQHALSVVYPSELRVWSGKLLGEDIISDFQRGPIRIHIRKVTNFGANTLIAKKVTNELGKGAIEKLPNIKPKSKEVEEGMKEVKKGVESIQKTWNEWFGDPLLNTPPPICTEFTYSGWGECDSDNIQTRTIVTKSPSKCTDGNPEALSRYCQ